MTGRRTAAFAALCLVCAAGAGVYVYHAIQRAQRWSAPHPDAHAGPGGAAQDLSGEVLLFRSTATDASYGKLALAPVANAADRRIVETLSCERVDYAGGRGVCLTAARGVVTTYTAIVFDDTFTPIHTLALAGAPSRVRVSPDGALAAITVFVSGHSYSADFSTVTSIVDLRRGDYLLPNFEQLDVSDGGQTFQAVDRNFWGVTFARDSDAFYATVGSAGRTHLIAGTIRSRRAALLRDDVECPSLSPDNSRLAFKRRIAEGVGPVRWRLSVLDLGTLDVIPLAETRNVDDQVAWLDNQRITYSMPDAESGSAATTTWVVDADGGGGPRVLVPQAYSAVVFARSPAATPTP